MHKWMWTGLAAVAVSTAAMAALPAAPEPAIGAPAANFKARDMNGNWVELAQYRGKTVVLEWNNPGCPFVQKHYQGSGNLPATQKAAVADGAVWLQINSGHDGAQGDYDAKDVKAWQTQNGVAATAYLRDQDGKVGKAYDARHTPTLYVVKPDGTLAYAGGIDDINSTDASDIPKATNYVKAALSDLKAGRPVAKATTKAYGCSVKY